QTDFEGPTPIYCVALHLVCSFLSILCVSTAHLETPDTLMGIPVYQSADMPPTMIAVADFKQAYKIVDNRGMRILRDPYTNKPYVRFFVTKRVGGEVVNTSAIKLLKIASKY
ncbi:phage major capsid protein, partial [Wolbachia endosymbiont of Laodelphax striatellus]|uniref:phage major capsid protein n=1 Tax=Wolbachia endosymbiont of Laodelphax striatellus TaxID=368602 RepID=UPI000ABF7FDC